MNLRERIARRRSTRTGPGLVVDERALSPATHVPEPVGRGSTLERLLDAIEPVFDGETPPDVAVVGPKGVGKSALVGALFTHLGAVYSPDGDSFRTSTRGGSGRARWFVHLDCRRATTPFAVSRTVLSAVAEESPPGRGVGTGELRERLARRVRESGNGLVVAADHLGAPDALPLDEVRDLLAPVDGLTVVPVARAVPDGFDGRVVEVPTYHRHALVDVVTERASQGLTEGALSHAAARDLAEWAEGDAHDALAALFGAAVAASSADADRIRDADLAAGRDAVPRPCCHVESALSLSDSRRTALAGLLAVWEREGVDVTVDGAARAVAGRDDCDLSPATVKRFLYELAESGVLRREPMSTGTGGRPPSRLEPAFPTVVFRELVGEERPSLVTTGITEG